MSPMAGVGTLSTAAVAVHDVTGPALKDVLVDVLLPRPGEGAAVVAAQHDEWGVVWVAVCRADGRQEHGLLVSEGCGKLEELNGHVVRTAVDSKHEGGHPK